MRSKVGLWIDHRQAVIVTLTANGAVLNRIMSNVETQPRREGDSPLSGSYESLQVPADDRHLRAVKGHLAAYYDRVVESTQVAESILIFGPGEAKGELKKHLDAAGLGSRIVGVDTTDKMTDSQIEAKVTQHFAKGA